MDQLDRTQFAAARLVEDLRALNEFGAVSGGGVHRVAYSPDDLRARDWLDDELRALGLDVRRDGAGNTIAVYPGEDPDLPAIGVGSHTDSVPNGGLYDGSLGVAAALGCVRALAEAGVKLRHPVAVFNFEAEEATVGGGTLGSRAMAGTLAPDVLEQSAWDGRTVAEHLRGAGLTPEGALAAQLEGLSVCAYVELHVEQGGILEQLGVPIGVVEGIAGIRRYRVSFAGHANHAGTTPMEGRKDALVAAAQFVLEVRAAAEEHGIVGTTGTLTITPGSPNVIPGEAVLGVELRSLDGAALDAAEEALTRHAARLDGQLERTGYKQEVASDGLVTEAIENAGRGLGLESHRMASGAGHDAGWMARLAPSAMIFVPSRGGMSHSPDEFTSDADCANGGAALFETVLQLDQLLDQ